MRKVTRRHRRPLSLVRTATLAAVLALVVAPGQSDAQRSVLEVSVGAGTEVERYLRALQLAGRIPQSQWTVRRFGPTEISAMTITGNHPWSRRFAGSSGGRRDGVRVLSPSITTTVNSSFPYGFNDGPVWTGKGVTVAASGGIAAQRSGFSVALEPLAFLAQNADFTIEPTAGGPYSDRYTPLSIDQPQRFGPRAYGRLDPGESHARWDGHGVAVGLATDAEFYGPATEHPLILGNNAGGIPRAFVGTERPLDLRYVTLHGRMFWGRVDESSFGPDTGTERRHFATAAVAVMTVKAIPGLELGGARFFHAAWPTGGIAHAPWLQVFHGVLPGAFIERFESGSSSNTTDNQLASVFGRWALPASGLEVYGEYGREDRNANLDDFIQEPDHDAAYLLGFARAWMSAPGDRLTVVRAELLNSRNSHLAQGRLETPWYVHMPMRNGHTERGQVLGSAGAHGGGAGVVAIDRYSPGGRTTIRWDRLVFASLGAERGLTVTGRVDQTHAIGIERASLTARGELTITASLAKDFNRYFHHDAVNASLAVSYRIIR